MAVGFVGAFFRRRSCGGAFAERVLHGCRFDSWVRFAISDDRQTALSSNPVANRCQFGGLVRVSLFRPLSCSASFDESTGVFTMSIWQLGSLGGLRHGCFRENDLTQSLKKNHAKSSAVGNAARLISPSWNFAMNETLCFNIRHTATASPDSAGTRLAVGQAFQPDTSGCQAGKPDLLQTPLSSHVPGHCFFAYFLLCGFAALRENLRFLLQTTSKCRDCSDAERRGPRFGATRRVRPWPADSVADWTAGLPLPLEAGDLSVGPAARSGDLATSWRECARERAAKSALPSQVLIRVRVRHGFGVIVKIMLVS